MTSKIGLDHFLDVHPNINKIYLCLDHDIAGIEGAERRSDFLNEKRQLHYCHVFEQEIKILMKI